MEPLLRGFREGSAVVVATLSLSSHDESPVPAQIVAGPDAALDENDLDSLYLLYLVLSATQLEAIVEITEELMLAAHNVEEVGAGLEGSVVEKPEVEVLDSAAKEKLAMTSWMESVGYGHLLGWRRMMLHFMLASKLSHSNRSFKD